MNNTSIELKIKNRLNKLDSADNENLACWVIVEAFNKAQRKVVRDLLYSNQEYTVNAISDIQPLVSRWEGDWSKHPDYYESCGFPSDFMKHIRIEGKAYQEECGERDLTIYLVNDYELDILLKHENKKPSYLFAETLATITDNKIRVYTNNEFTLKDLRFIYYKQPVDIKIDKCYDLSSESESTVDVECEFKDDFVEEIITKAVEILDNDLRNTNGKYTEK